MKRPRLAFISAALRRKITTHALAFVIGACVALVWTIKYGGPTRVVSRDAALRAMDRAHNQTEPVDLEKILDEVVTLVETTGG